MAKEVLTGAINKASELGDRDGNKSGNEAIIKIDVLNENKIRDGRKGEAPNGRRKRWDKVRLGA